MSLSHYTRLRRLGKGSFGEVYLVVDKRDQQQYVMKEIDVGSLGPKGRREALKEVSFLSAMHHPYIVQYKECFEDVVGNRKLLLIIMEYASGGDLASKMKQQKQPFTEAQIIKWFIQMCLALKHIHDRKIIHRDIKSENVFLTHDFNVKIGDFGISKSMPNTMANALTRIGTPYYLSPEICMNKPYNMKSDMWSLGVVLYEMLSLRHPFDANSMEALLQKIVRGQPAPLPRHYSVEIRTVVDSLLQKQPQKRPTVNALLKLPFLAKEIEKHMTERERAEEFAHTILHGDLKQYELNHDRDRERLQREKEKEKEHHMMLDRQREQEREKLREFDLQRERQQREREQRERELLEREKEAALLQQQREKQLRDREQQQLYEQREYQHQQIARQRERDRDRDRDRETGAAPARERFVPYYRQPPTGAPAPTLPTSHSPTPPSLPSGQQAQHNHAQINFPYANMTNAEKIRWIRQQRDEEDRRRREIAEEERRRRYEEQRSQELEREQQLQRDREQLKEKQLAHQLRGQEYNLPPALRNRGIAPVQRNVISNSAPPHIGLPSADDEESLMRQRINRFQERKNRREQQFHSGNVLAGAQYNHLPTNFPINPQYPSERHEPMRERRKQAQLQQQPKWR